MRGDESLFAGALKGGAEGYAHAGRMHQCKGEELALMVWTMSSILYLICSLYGKNKKILVELFDYNLTFIELIIFYGSKSIVLKGHCLCWADPSC